MDPMDRLGMQIVELNQAEMLFIPVPEHQRRCVTHEALLRRIRTGLAGEDLLIIRRGRGGIINQRSTLLLSSLPFMHFCM